MPEVSIYLYSRVPELFRDFHRAGAQAIDDANGAGESGLYRHVQRLREINLSSIIQATAADRMQRAMDARALQPYRTWSWKPATWCISIANRQPMTCQAGGDLALWCRQPVQTPVTSPYVGKVATCQ